MADDMTARLKRILDCWTAFCKDIEVHPGSTAEAEMRNMDQAIMGAAVLNEQQTLARKESVALPDSGTRQYGDAFEFWWSGTTGPGFPAQFKEVAWEAWKASARRPTAEESEGPTAPDTDGTWEQRCAALYQVIGALSHLTGVFEHSDDVADALDVAAGRGDVEKLLPWPKDAKLGVPLSASTRRSAKEVAAKIIADYLEHYSFPSQGESHMHDCIMDALESTPVSTRTELSIVVDEAEKMARLINDCAPWLKEDETPAQRIEREWNDSQMLLAKLAALTKAVEGLPSGMAEMVFEEAKTPKPLSATGRLP